MTPPAKPTSWQLWLMASRPKTLPAAVGPVLVGTGAAWRDGGFALFPALAALGGALLLQIGVNLANDYFDNQAGIDTEERLGPTRVAASGLVSPARLRWWMAGVFGAAVLLGVYLMLVGGWPVVAIGLSSIVAALLYSGGPFPFASRGLGDLFVFIFFGLAAVCGTYYVQALQWSWVTLMAAISPGALITAILVVNNLRDIETDRKVGKNTLAVILGDRGTRIEFTLLMAVSYVIPFVLVGMGLVSIRALFPIVSIFQAIRITRHVMQGVSGRDLNKTLAETAQLSLIFSVLLGLGLAVG